MKNLMTNRVIGSLAAGTALLVSSSSANENGGNIPSTCRFTRNLEMTFTTEAGKYYQPQTTEDLQTWQNFGNTIYGTGEDEVVIFPNADKPREFYRVGDDGNPANLPDLLACKIDWARLQIDPLNNDVRFFDVAVAPDNSLAVAYTMHVSTPNGNEWNLMYAAEANSWAVETVALSVYHSPTPHLEFGTDGVIRIAYAVTQGQWSIAEKNAGTWSSEAILPDEGHTNTFAPAFLSLHPVLRFAAANSGGNNPRLLYFEEQPDGSVVSEATDPSTIGTPLSIVERPNGQIVIATPQTSSLALYFQQSSGWTKQNTPYAGDVTFYQGAQMKINTAGQIRIAAPLRLNFGNNDYRVVHAREEDGFTFEIVHLHPDLNMSFDDVNLEITPQGTSVLSYLYNQEVRMAFPNPDEPGGWETSHSVDRRRLPQDNKHLSKLESTILPDGRLVYVYENQDVLTVARQRSSELTPSP